MRAAGLSRIGAVLVAAAAFVGCRPGQRGMKVPVGGTIDEYETALARNAADLRAAGLAPQPAPGEVGGAAYSGAAGDRGGGDAPAAGDESAADDALGTDVAPPQPAAESEESEESRDYAIVSERGVKRKDKRSRRCTRICDLAEISCELQDHVCELAGRHEGEERYEAACQRAREQCELASDACTACTD